MPIGFVTRILEEHDSHTGRPRMLRSKDRTSNGLTFFVLVAGLNITLATKDFSYVANLGVDGNEVESLNNLLY